MEITDPKKILVVDDESNWQVLLQKFLRLPKFQTTVAKTYEEAENFLHSSTFDLVTVNVNLVSEEMQDGLGVDLLKILQKDHPRLPRIAITGAKFGGVFSKFSPFDVDDVLIKGTFTRSHLIDSINQAITTRKKKIDCDNDERNFPMKLSHDDQKKLFEELNKLPQWVDGGVSGEKSVLRNAGLPDSLINNLKLEGAPGIDTPNVITHLKNLGHLSGRPTHKALGAFIEYLFENTDVEGKMFFAYLIKQYQLITDLDYIEELQQKYALFELPITDTIEDLGWNLPQQPSFLWQGTSDSAELEKVWNKGAPFLDAVFLEKGAQVARAVCRVEGSNGGLGTGFMIAPNLVLTNHHVVPTDEEAKDVIVRFGYRFDETGKRQDGETYRIKQAIKRSLAADLDYVVLETEGSPGEDEKIGFLKPISKTLQARKSVFIIQHPLGEPQKVVLQSNWITYVAEDHSRLQYLTNTERGSSGSPVCDENWDVVALHHSSGPLPALSKTKNIRGNEGIPMMAILQEIKDLLP